MTRSHHHFACGADQLTGTLDKGARTTGLLLVSGGNEIRSGAHAGMARLAQETAAQGNPVFRYDRRGIGDSGGENRGFLETAEDIAAATTCFRSLCPEMRTIVAFGNCDAASALVLFGAGAGIDRLVLANPWIIEASQETDDAEPPPDSPTTPPPAAIRARYWERLKNPRTIVDLFTGKIDFGKLARGMRHAAQKQDESALALRIGAALAETPLACQILIAERDTTARTFTASWAGKSFDKARQRPDIALHRLDSASHSFADDEARAWLQTQLWTMLENS